MAAVTFRRALVGLCGMLLLGFSAPNVLADDPVPVVLPLDRVVLFTSGVGFFEHRGKVEGNSRVDLRFNVSDINDLLKSLVLEDHGGGQISTVTYDSRDPLAKTLRAFSVDLTAEPTVSDLLRQLRGEPMRLESFVQGIARDSTGQVMGVERRLRGVSKEETQSVDYVNLLTPTGLRSIPLDTITEFRLLDEKLNQELQEALMVVARRHARDKKTVTIKFSGQGQRPVRVGYILETPLWKTSYRLVLKDAGPPLLQGWAIVENTTDRDWQDVRLTLVSGRPISFTMDLYEPLYVARPAVAPETFGTLRPQIHNQNLASGEEQFRRAARRGTGMGGGMGGGGGYFGGTGGGAPPAENKAAEPALDPGAGVRSAAQGGDVGELFRYQIAAPATIVRQQSAMIPIVNDSIKAEKVSLYNPAVQPKHPLCAVQLVNTTALHLMQGPIAVFDGGEYAGDARIEDLAPAGRRLISYALDLDTEIVREAKTAPDELMDAKVVAGVMELSHRQRRSQRYTLKNSGSRPKNVLIEQPIDADWRLVGDKPSEQTRNLYRFAVTAEPGKPAELCVDEQKITAEQVALLTLVGDEQIGVYLRAPVIHPTIREALQEIGRRRLTLAQLSAERAFLREKIGTVDTEQARIRQNMGQLDRTSDLYKRYVKMFNEQEDQIEKLRPQVTELAAAEAQAASDLRQFVQTLNLNESR